ncbi:MAG TPA: cytosine permease [Thermoanaerobaculia bacterium]
MQAADIGVVGEADRKQSPLDLFLIFAGANIVATTIQTGASLVPAFSFRAAVALVGVGSLVGALLVAALSPLGPRLGVPSVVAARAALGFRGAAAVALVLYVSNFAWIAVNNVIAASACARVLGGAGSERAWAVGLGVLATAIAAGGPKAVGLADRVAVPLLLVVGVWFTVACFRLPAEVVGAAGDGSISWPRERRGAPTRERCSRRSASAPRAPSSSRWRPSRPTSSTSIYRRSRGRASSPTPRTACRSGRLA